METSVRTDYGDLISGLPFLHYDEVTECNCCLRKHLAY